jgi:hypothetical protein
VESGWGSVASASLSLAHGSLGYCMSWVDMLKAERIFQVRGISKEKCRDIS